MDKEISSEPLKSTFARLGNGNYEHKTAKKSIEELVSIKNKGREPFQSVPNISTTKSRGSNSIFAPKKVNEVKRNEGQPSIMKEMVSELSENLEASSSDDYLDTNPSCGFIYATQDDAQNDVISVVIQKEGTFQLERKPHKQTFIEYITHEKTNGNGKNLGKQIVIEETNFVDFGLKITSLNNIQQVLLGASNPILGKSYFPGSELVGGASTANKVNEFFRKLVNKVYGYELCVSSPSGLSRNNPNESFPVVKVFTFQLEKEKIELIMRVAQRKFKNIMDDTNTMIYMGKTKQKLKSVVYKIVRTAALKMREKFIKHLRAKAIKLGTDQIGFIPIKISDSRSHEREDSDDEDSGNNWGLHFRRTMESNVDLNVMPNNKTGAKQKNLKRKALKMKSERRESSGSDTSYSNPSEISIMEPQSNQEFQYENRGATSFKAKAQRGVDVSQNQTFANLSPLQANSSPTAQDHAGVDLFKKHVGVNPSLTQLSAIRRLAERNAGGTHSQAQSGVDVSLNERSIKISEIHRKNNPIQQMDQNISLHTNVSSPKTGINDDVILDQMDDNISKNHLNSNLPHQMNVNFLHNQFQMSVNPPWHHLNANLPRRQMGANHPQNQMGTKLPVSQMGVKLPQSQMVPKLPHSQMVPKLPHSQMGTKLPHSQMGTKLSHSLMGTKLPHSQIGTKLPHSQMSTKLPHSQMVSKLSQSPMANKLPHSQMDSKLPHSQMGVKLPWNPMGVTLPQNQMGENLSPHQLGVNLPQTQSDASLPLSETGDNLPHVQVDINESYAQVGINESHAQVDINETYGQVDINESYGHVDLNESLLTEGVVQTPQHNVVIFNPQSPSDLNVFDSTGPPFNIPLDFLENSNQNVLYYDESLSIGIGGECEISSIDDNIDISDLITFN